MKANQDEVARNMQSDRSLLNKDKNDNERSIDVLNSLVEINNDRIEGYETASKETEETDLKTLFSQFILTSQKCRQELTNEIRRIGGTPTEATKVSGKFFRTWMDVKAALTNKDRKAILGSCEFGEEAAIDTYDKVLSDHPDDISSIQKVIISAQRASIKADYDKIRHARYACGTSLIRVFNEQFEKISLFTILLISIFASSCSVVGGNIQSRNGCWNFSCVIVIVIIVVLVSRASKK